MNTYTVTQFKLFRILFGFYLVWHFISLISFSEELFSNHGMIYHNALNPSSHFININGFNDPYVVSFVIYTLLFSSIMFTFGIFRRLNSLILWIGWIYLFLLNNFISNPSIPFIGLLLLSFVIIPSTNSPNWHMPDLIYWGFWFLTALSYTISGIHKIQCPSWVNGTALYYVYNSVLSRENFIVHCLLYLPNLLQLITWGTLLLEITFLPFGMFLHTRRIYWTLSLFLHIGILFTVNFADLTLGMLVSHLFLFDISWLK